MIEIPRRSREGSRTRAGFSRMCMTFQSLVARSAAQNGAVKKDFRALGSEAELSRPSLTPTQSFVRVRAGNTGLCFPATQLSSHRAGCSRCPIRI